MKSKFLIMLISLSWHEYISLAQMILWEARSQFGEYWTEWNEIEWPLFVYQINSNLNVSW